MAPFMREEKEVRGKETPPLADGGMEAAWLPPQGRAHECGCHPSGLPPITFHVRFLGQVGAVRLKCRTVFPTPHSHGQRHCSKRKLSHQ